MIRTGFPAYEGHGAELNATISTVGCEIGPVTISTPGGEVYVLPLGRGALVLSAAPVYAAQELWERLSERIIAGEITSDENTAGRWSVSKPAGPEFDRWAEAVISKWRD